ncbi:hypothetical protein ACSX1A_02405 [Pontibacter sp. MBLB2868]|uniref:hypothetical protein n=1 Tax=Pontibacter sp. MBLB2868 TaxID=3451555 RepID=UPI003F74CC4B
MQICTKAYIPEIARGKKWSTDLKVELTGNVCFCSKSKQADYEKVSIMIIDRKSPDVSVVVLAGGVYTLCLEKLRAKAE